jgi:hypothetical protein
MPILWEFWKRICAFREGVMPTVPAAAKCIQLAWRYHGCKAGATGLKAKLAAIEFKRVRALYYGIKETVIAEMETTQRPPMPTRVIPASTAIVIDVNSSVSDVAVTSPPNSKPINLVVVVDDEYANSYVPVKRSTPDYQTDNGEQESNSKIAKH